MMPKQVRMVIPIFVSELDQLVAEFAFNLWLSSAFRTAPEKALLTSVEMLRGKTSAELFFVPRRNSKRGEIRHPVPMRRRSGREP